MTQILNTDLNRRTLLQGAAAVTVPIALGKSRKRRRVPNPGLPYVRAAQAEELAASIGVVTHLHFGKSVYRQTDRVVDAIADLGVRHVRNRITRTTGGRRGFAALAERGVKIHGVCGAMGDPQTMFEVMSEVVRTYQDPAAVFSAFEGINEPNNNGVPWIEETRAKTRALYLQRNAHGLGKIPIVGPALARVNSGGAEGRDTATQSANLGDLRRYIDVGNIHVYPRAQTPSTDIDEFMGYQRMVCGDLPVMCTEGGYFTALNYRGGANPCTKEAAAKYVPRQIMEHWTRGNKRFFVYELLDDYDPSNADRESNFGLMEVADGGGSGEWTPKAHYNSIKNFVSILGDKGAAHEARGMRLTVTGAPGVRTALVAKRNRARYLLMWRDVSSYDHAERVLTSTPSETATVTLARRRDVKIFNPTQSDRPLERFNSVSKFDVRIGDELVICRIR